MTKHTLEQRIRTAVEHAAPDQLDSILSSCKSQGNAADASLCPEHTEARKKGVIIPMTGEKSSKNRKKSSLMAIAAVAAVFVLCLGGFQLFQKDTALPFDSVIMLDVNPSLSLYVDANETVLSAEALNDDAKEVLGSMELKNTSLEVAVNAIIGSMLQKGYLNDTQNSILVSVENGDAVRGEELQEKVSQIIASAMQPDALDAAILSQTISADDAALAELAKEYDISLGKAALIQEVIAQAPTLTFDDLAPMTINEIALIAASKNVSSESVTQNGMASDKAYIGHEEALRLVCTHAGVALEDVIKMAVEFDSDHGIMIYEIEFETAAKKGEYEINASTGEVIKSELKDQKGSVEASGYIGAAAAKQAALLHAGVAAEDVLDLEVELDSEDHIMIYKVEFETAAKKFEYEINASTGGILDFEIRNNGSYTAVSVAEANTSANSGTNSGGTSSGTAYIGESAAKSAALADAGVSSGDTYFITWYFGYNNGKPVCYYVKFGAGNTVYLYKIDLYTGAVLNRETYPGYDHGDNNGYQGSSGSAGTSYIGESAALAAALGHAGVSESSLRSQEVEFDERGSTVLYEIEFKTDRVEYHYEVDAVSGEILKAQNNAH